MGKLNIAHHKSYHPYRRDNIERVRRDEEQAKLEEEAKEGKILVADAEARLELLRQKAGMANPGRPTRDEEVEADRPVAGPSSLISGGHINLFEDLEKQNMAVMVKTVSKKNEPTELGVPLAPLEKDRKPWYSDKNHERNRGSEGDKGLRDQARKSVHDPLTSINQQLAKLSDDTRPFSRSKPRPRDNPPPPRGTQPQVAERLTRESSERQRALELIARKKREMAGSDTPSTVSGGMDGGYGDQYNRRDVEDAHRFRDRRDERRGGGGSSSRRW